ncbi:probable serine/threonine-protein kinase kinX [Calliphora vicina]|uniref:probable serine/threonine-protein kinase kinX n=1 Tax=Calliphora vicina TaxID=7373 RepID=UPI00325B284A
MKLLVFTCAVTALLLCASPVRAEEKEDVMVEQTTESPIADMALVDHMKADSGMKPEKQVMQKLPAEVQPQTIADFIIHPLIALKPRVPEIESGKQAETGSTTPSPWQLFGFNAGQGLGSSVQSLAGSVTGWLGNRIQLPGLVDTPVRESSTSTSTTTTTVRPDVVVRVKQRASTRKPLIAINNDNDRPYRKNKRPNNFNGNSVDESEEEDDSEEDDEDNYNGNRKRYQNHDEDDEDDDASNENNHEDDEEEDEEDDGNNRDDEDEEEEERPVKQQNNNRRRNPKPLNHSNNKRRNTNNNQRRRINNNQRKRNQQRQKQQQQEESAEEEQYDDDDNDNDNNNEQDFYYQGSKRSQNEQNFIQRGQQSLLNQIRQFTRGQSPAEVSNNLRKSANKKRRQQATLLINRNGQTIYVAPELLQVAEANNNKYSATKTKRPSSQYPQPPLTVPYRRKGQPTQYITIPWNQLGISPPDQILSLTEGIQSQPLILNIPQNAIDNMQSLSLNKKKPGISADAVPLLAEASIMDIFKPPRIPPARTPTTKKTTNSHSPVVIAARPKPGHTRIRPATLVEKAPADDNMDEEKTETMDNGSESAQFIVIGDESGETELSRGAYKQILDYFNQQRIGRQLNVDEAAVAAMETPKIEEQMIPVRVIFAEEEPAKVEVAVSDKMDMVTESTVMDSLKEETKVEDAEPMMESPVMVSPKEETVEEDKPMMESSVMVIPMEESVEETKVDKAEPMMESPVMVSPMEEPKVDMTEAIIMESSTSA